MTPPPLAAQAQQPADDRRRQILSAARACFARAGFHGASMGQVCAEAQMSPGALYRYFPSKDAIIEAIAEEERAGAVACLEHLRGPGTIADRLVAMAMDYLASARDPESGGLMIEICSESLRNTAVGARFCELETLVRDRMRAAVEDARERGEVPRDLDLDIALTMIFSFGDGLMMRLQFERDVALEAIEPHLRRILRALLRMDEV
ncbi:TetR/AcrR family transcriptional regulator [Aureimonas flava]|uniref:TetR/AcrR family transcriptional regulator n=1 Tax=Aureimonas flava TaxID=2320271 RepID=A0A3A1WLP8_9HYPH|nr:TetR/AcrR family transcriptional regulator [Aureimonas flava]RIY02467.1 TetR/AcrR family transcriptional regulator [Aureimonas flava]